METWKVSDGSRVRFPHQDPTSELVAALGRHHDGRHLVRDVVPVHARRLEPILGSASGLLAMAKREGLHQGLALRGRPPPWPFDIAQGR